MKSSVSSSSIASTVSLLTCVFAMAAPVNAALILTEDSRRISADATAGQFDSTQSQSAASIPDGAFLPFDGLETVSANGNGASALAVARQTSTLTTQSISASGSVRVVSDDAGDFDNFASASASSDFRVGFVLDTPHQFNLSGVVSSSGDEFDSTASVSLLGGDDFFSTLQLTFTSLGADGETPFELSGVLNPDSYILTGISGSLGGFTGGVTNLSAYDFEFSVAAVPVPAAVWMLASALLATGFVRRRSRARG